MRLLNGASNSDILERQLISDWVLSIGDVTIGESTYPNILESMSNITYF